MIDLKGDVHVIDFGVARFREDVSVSHVGATIGTPMYMSPEHITGRVNILPSSDIFSLGIVLYEALTLRPPYTASTREGILRQIATKPMPPVSSQNPAVSRNLEAVVHKAIARDPDDRYSSKRFAQELHHVINGKPITARRYHYKVDNHEIAAERPNQVLYSIFISGSYSFLTIAYLFVRFIDPTYRYQWYDYGYGIADIIWMLSLNSVLLGKRAAIWAFTASICLTCIVMHITVFHSNSASSLTRQKYVFNGIVYMCLAYSIVALHLPRTRSWVRIAQSCREEFRRNTRRRINLAQPRGSKIANVISQLWKQSQ